MNRNDRDDLGKRFARLVAIKHVTGSNPKRYIYQCDCGNQKEAYAGNVRSGNVRSCGCLRSELTSARETTHGHSRNYTSSPEFRCWMSMRTRCSNQKLRCYPRYGGRGIRVCDRWQEFENFLADMGPRPSPAHSIEREDSNGNYEPGNCRWATPKEQAANRCDTVRIEHNGRTMILADWARETGVDQAVIRRRMKRGATFEQAISVPKGKRLEITKRAKRRTKAEMAAARDSEQSNGSATLPRSAA